MEVTRTQILNGNYKFPNRLLKLIPTDHFKSRLEERGIGLECVPTLVRVTRDNIYCGKINSKGKLNSVVIRLLYKNDKYIFLCFNPYDRALKTMWFGKVK